MVSGGKVNGDGETVFVCARRRAYGQPACDTGMHVKVSDLERAMRDEVTQWAADIDAAARDRAQQAARDSAEAGVARLEARDGELRGRLRRLALERIADAEAGGILGDDAWAEAALALREEHSRILGDLERARTAAAAGPPADSMTLLPDLLAQWDILPASALNAILQTVVRRVAVYRQSPRRQGPGGRWVPAENRFEVLPVWEDDPWKGKMPQRGQRISGLPAVPPGSGPPGYVHPAAQVSRRCSGLRCRHCPALRA